MKRLVMMYYYKLYNEYDLVFFMSQVLLSKLIYFIIKPQYNKVYYLY